MEFLGKIAANNEATQNICEILQRHNLIQVWPLSLQGESEQDVGLFRIDEAALNQLSPDAFKEIRQAGALPVIYCQLLSMQNLARLSELSKVHAELEKPTQSPIASLFEDDGSLNFDNLG